MPGAKEALEKAESVCRQVYFPYFSKQKHVDMTQHDHTWSATGHSGKD